MLYDRTYHGPRSLLAGLAHQRAGRTDNALAQFREAERLLRSELATDTDNEELHLVLAVTLACAGRAADARSELGLVEPLLKGRSPSIYWGAQVLAAAQAYGVMGDFGNMAQWLRKLFVMPNGFPFTPASLRLDPRFTGMLDAPEMQALLKEFASLDQPQGNASAVGPDQKSAPADKSVAVLAFKNLSGDPAREFFSDGLSEAVTDVLGRVPGLKVVGSASAFSFKGKSVSIPEIARQLGVSHLVEGTVLQEGQTVRITAKLITADGFQVWVSDKLDRELKNIFALHDEVAGLIAKNLSLKLGASSAASKAPVNPEAFELYLRARQATILLTAAGFDQAESALNRALELEPNFARAHAALADVWTHRYRSARQTGTAEDQSRPNKSARIMAKITQSLALDPDSTEAHTARGFLLIVDGKYAEAESALRRAVTLNPNYAPARLWLGRALLTRGQMDEALEHLKLASELDPLSRFIWRYYGDGLFFAGRKTEGIIALDRSLALGPDSPVAVARKCFALLELGRVTEAVALVRRMPGEDRITSDAQLRVFAQAGLKAEAEALLAASRSPADTSFRWAAGGLVALGRTDEALTLMTPKSISSSDTSVSDYLWDPIFDPVRNDPRWVKLMADAGLTEAHARAQAWRAAHPPEKPGAKK